MNSQRACAFAIALIALIGLVIRIYLHQVESGSIAIAFSHLYQFFTIWTNTLVLLIMALTAVGCRVPRRVLLATTVAIIGVGIIFHALIGSPVGQQGLDLTANLITHTYIPILSCVWWLMFESRAAFKWKDSLTPLVWPAVYCLYALIRAEFSGFYPYSFIDLSTLGAVGLLKSILSITVAFWVLGLILMSFANIRSKL